LVSVQTYDESKIFGVPFKLGLFAILVEQYAGLSWPLGHDQARNEGQLPRGSLFNGNVQTFEASN
jgi:hypothetical protein